MTNETVIEELVAQRDFLLANTWVQHPPTEIGEGCLVARREKLIRHNPNIPSHWDFDEMYLGDYANCLVQRVIGLEETGCAASSGEWNDEKCRSAGEAIAVLEEAIRIAKEDAS